MKIVKELEELLDLYGEQLYLIPEEFLADRLVWDKSYIDDINSLDDEKLDKPTDKARLIEILQDFKFMESEGGPDQGTEAESIYYFPNVDTYIRFSGSYYSYDGYDYSHMQEVKPKKVEVIKYFP